MVDMLCEEHPTFMSKTLMTHEDILFTIPASKSKRQTRVRQAEILYHCRGETMGYQPSTIEYVFSASGMVS